MSLLRTTLLALALTTAAAHANDEDLYFSALPRVLTVSRLPQPQSEAPGSVTLLDRELIRASGARQLSDLLRLVPGFQVTPAAADPARVTYHGLGEEFPPRVQVLVDGRPQYSPLFQGGVNWNLIPVALDDIERIEVIRGSNSAAYGANAFLGVINIITLDASQQRGFSVFGQHGSNGVSDHGLRWGGQLGDMHLRLTYQEQRDRGLINWPDDRHQRLFDLRGDWQLTARDELQVGLGQVESATQNGRLTDPGDPLRVFRQRSSHVQLGWRHVTADDGEVRTRFSHIEDWGSDAHLEHWSTTLNPTIGDEPFSFFVDYGGRAVRDELEIQHTLPTSAQMRVVWGMGLRNEGVRSPQYYSSVDMRHRSMARLFGNLEWRLTPQWLLNAGATLERDSLSGVNLAPRINISHHLTDEQTVRVGISRAHRTPSMMESRGDFRYTSLDGRDIERNALGNPDLKPESVTAYEIGYLGDFRASRSSLDVRLFAEYVRDRIIAGPVGSPPPCDVAEADLRNPCGRVDYYVNGENAVIRGLEYQWRWQPFDNTRLLVNQAYMRITSQLLDTGFIDTQDNIDKISRHTRQSAPSRSTTVMLMQKLPANLQASIIWHQVDDMRWTRNTWVDSYQRLDYRLSQPFVLAGQRAEWAYTVQSAHASHAEFRSNRLITPVHWFSLRLDLF